MREEHRIIGDFGARHRNFDPDWPIGFYVAGGEYCLQAKTVEKLVAGLRKVLKQVKAKENDTPAVRDCYGTPFLFYDELNEEFHFTVDAAANSANAKHPFFWNEDVDGLKQDWSKHVVFCNPPYSNVRPWVKKAYEESLRGATVVMVLNVSTGSKWWHDYVVDKCEVRFLKGRLRFIPPPGVEESTPRYDNVVLVYRPAAKPFTILEGLKQEQIEELFIEQIRNLMQFYGSKKYDAALQTAFHLEIQDVTNKYSDFLRIKCQFVSDASNNPPNGNLLCAEFCWVSIKEAFGVKVMRCGDPEYTMAIL